MERGAVVDWVEAYITAWETYSPEAIADLFSPDANYYFHPYDEPVVGREAIVASWLKEPDAPGTWEANYEPIAVDGDVAVLHGRSRYFKDSSRTELTGEWDNIFVIQFDSDGRCRSLREWYGKRPEKAG